MLTPEQQKLFRFLYLLGKSYGVPGFEFEVEFDDYLTGEPFDISNFSRVYSRGKLIEIPQKPAQELTDFMNEKVFPQLESSLEQILENNDVDEASSIRLSVSIDINNRNFLAQLQANWYGYQEGDSGEEEMPEDVSDEISQSVPEGTVKQASIEYSGGGDSGEWGDEIQITTNGGRTLMAPVGTRTDDWISRNLPGGWEIDEGSSGSVVFDFEDNQIYINHTWNTYDEGTDVILDFDF